MWKIIGLFFAISISRNGIMDVLKNIQGFPLPLMATAKKQADATNPAASAYT